MTIDGVKLRRAARASTARGRHAACPRWRRLAARLGWASTAAACAALAFTSADAAAAGPRLSIPNRPFAIQLGALSPTFDGVFEASLGRQAIGVFVQTTTARRLRDVVVRASVPASSAIRLTKRLAAIPILRPGVPTLVRFEGDFGSVAPGKYPLSVRLTSPRRVGFARTATRSLFVQRSTPDPVRIDRWSGTTDVGRVDFDARAIYGGTNLASLSTITAFRWTVTYDEPFAGQLGPLPFGDPWWKVAGAVSMIAGGVGYIGGAITVYASYDPATGNLIKDISTGAATAGGGAALLDVKDPIRRGQEHTVPLPGERTLRELLTVTNGYPQEPVVGTVYPIDVSWVYTRITTGNAYSYAVDERVTNHHATAVRHISIGSRRPRAGRRIVIRARTDARLRGNHGYFVATVFEGADRKLQSPRRVVTLKDDGTGADAHAGDAVFTGASSAPARAGAYRVFVHGYEMAPAPAGLPAELAAQHISGYLVSTPRLGEGLSVLPDATFRVR